MRRLVVALFVVLICAVGAVPATAQDVCGEPVDPAGAPAAPTGVTAELVGDGDVRIDWTDNREPDFSYYAVRRSTDPNSDKATWTRLPGNHTVSEVVDADAPAGRTVYYYVTAVDDGTADGGVRQVSDRSDVASVTTPAPASVQMPAGLDVALIPKLGTSPLDYFAHVNGTPPPGRKAYISDDLGAPAIRFDMARTDAPSPGDYAANIRRNQLIDIKRPDGSTYRLVDGATAWNAVRVKYGPRTSIDSSSFVAHFNWVSFINGQGSGPFGLGQDGKFSGREGLRLSTAFGIANPHYGTPGHHDYADLPFPDRWMDVLVGVRYSKSWDNGWLELQWKWASEPVSAFRAVHFPAPGNPTHYVTRTIGDTMNTINTGIYSAKAMDVQWGVAGVFIDPDKAKVLDAVAALGPAD